MRVMIGLALLLAGLTGALAQNASPLLGGSSGMSPAPAPSAPNLPRLNEEARAHQMAMDKRMDARTRRAIGSVCLGCGGGERPARGRSGGEAVAPSEPPIRDPAQAPVD